MKIQNTKSNKGITLIALIITIVVLLILAIVAIGTMEDSNIVGHAQNAASKYEEAKENELSFLSAYESKIEEIAGEKIVLTPPGGEDAKITIFLAKGTILYEVEGQSFTGKFSVIDTEEALEAVLNNNSEVSGDMPKNTVDYLLALCISIESEGSAVIMITDSSPKRVYLEGEKWNLATYSVSNNTVEAAGNKFYGSLGDFNIL